MQKVQKNCESSSHSKRISIQYVIYYIKLLYFRASQFPLFLLLISILLVYRGPLVAALLLGLTFTYFWKVRQDSEDPQVLTQIS